VQLPAPSLQIDAIETPTQSATPEFSVIAQSPRAVDVKPVEREDKSISSGDVSNLPNKGEEKIETNPPSEVPNSEEHRNILMHTPVSNSEVDHAY